MSSSQSTTDLDSQIAKLEEKLNDLLDKVQEAQTTQPSSPPPQETTTPEPTTQTQEYVPPQSKQTSSGTKSRQEILAEYEKEYLARMEENARAEAEIKRAAAELESQKSSTQTSSTRGSLPKGF